MTNRKLINFHTPIIQVRVCPVKHKMRKISNMPKSRRWAVARQNGRDGEEPKPFPYEKISLTTLRCQKRLVFRAFMISKVVATN
jgi:hypothetical protein